MELLSVSLKNMEITVFGIKLRLGVIILIVVLYWLLWGHVLCSCSRVGLLEGVVGSMCKETNEDGTPILDSDGKPIKCPVVDGTAEAANSPSTTMMSANLTTDTAPAVAATVNPGFETTPTGISSFIGNMKEGFVGANTNYGQSSSYSLTNNKRINTSSWFSPNLTYTKGGNEGKAVKNILNRQKQPVPLPEGQLLMFANTPFKPECCPNAYSNSMGCACMTVDQYNYLIDRGGNNVPYSEY
jgi:hypothetical protein